MRKSNISPQRRNSAFQGLGLGGEWGGAVLLAIENAAPGKRGCYMRCVSPARCTNRPHSGGGYILADMDIPFRCPALRMGMAGPFLASIPLIIVGLWVLLSINETAEFSGKRSSEPSVSGC